MRGYYQTVGLAGWVLWAWVTMIFLFGSIMWLEVTVMNPITIAAYIAFAIVVLLIIFRERVTLENQVLRLRPLAGIHTERIPLDQMTHIQFMRHHKIAFSFDGERYQYWFSKKLYRQLKQELAQLGSEN